MCLCVRELNACEFLERQKCSDIVGSVRVCVCLCLCLCLCVCTRTRNIRTQSTHTSTVTFADDLSWQDDCADEPSLFTQYFSSDKKDDKQE